MTPRENQLLNIGSNSLNAEMPPSTNLLSRKVLWNRLAAGPEARTSFIESNLANHLAFQIRAMREREDWSQVQLAKRVGMNQNSISRLENPFYGKHTLTTLKRLASAFDVALVVRFVAYDELVDWVSGTPRVNQGLNQQLLNVPSYSDEKKKAWTSPIAGYQNSAQQMQFKPSSNNVISMPARKSTGALASSSGQSNVTGMGKSDHSILLPQGA